MSNYFLGYNQSGNSIEKLKKLALNGNFLELFSRGIVFIKKRFVRDCLSYFWFKRVSRNRNFFLDGKKYKYEINKKTFFNERMVEIPFFKKIVKENKDKRILEVGNVLPNFMDVRHDVLDKYEISNGVINKDVVDFSPKKKYDIIISISTLEHVGWDEFPREPRKIMNAIDNLKEIVKKGGYIIFSVPFDQNKFLDHLVVNKNLPVNKTLYVERVNYKKGWKQTNLENLKKTKSDLNIPRANGIVICYIKNEK